MKRAKIYLGDEALQNTLFDIKCPYYVEEVKAYILGAATAVDGITPTGALEFLLKDEEGVEIFVEDQEKYQKFSHQFFALWNEIAKAPFLDATPELSFYPYHFTSEDEMLQAAATRANEVKLFLLALMEGTHFCEVKEEWVSDLLFLLEDCAEKIHQAVLRLHDSFNDADLETIETAIAEIDKMWPAAYTRLNRCCLKLKKNLLQGKENNVIRADFGRRASPPS